MEASFANVISADSHVMEPPDMWEKALGAKFGDRTPRIIDEYKGKKGRYFLTGNQVRKLGEIEAEQDTLGFREAGYLPEKRVAFQEEAGVACELLYTTNMLLQYSTKNPDVLRAAAAVFNDWLAEFASYAPGRLRGIAVLPTHDVDWAIAEIERVSKKGLKGAMINLGGPEGCPPYRDAVYDPLWARPQAMGIPLTLHTDTGRIPDPLHFDTPAEFAVAASTMLGLMSEIMPVLADDFIFGGILDRFPELKIVCSEFDIAWLPNFMWRIDQMQNDMGPRLRLPKVALRASDYMRTRVWHGVINDPHSAYVIPQVGASQVLWGSDFPHVRSIGLDAQGAVARLLDGLPPEDQTRVVGGNATAVYGL